MAAGQGSVDGGAADAEQVGKLGGGVLPPLGQCDQVGFLAGLKLGLLAAEVTLGLGDPHPFAGPHPDQV